MKSLFIAVCLTASLTACTVVPVTTAMKTCDLLEIAFNEADMAAGWYLSSSGILEACGVPEALKKAEEKACYAQKRNGYSCK